MLLHWGHPPRRIAQHAEGLDHGHGLHGIEPNMLLKCEPAIKEKPKVPPGVLGLKGGVTRVWGKAQVDR